MKNKPSNIWYLLPFFGNIIGGIIGYLALKNRDKLMAENIIIIGMITFVASIILMLIGNKFISGYDLLLILFAITIIGILLGFLANDFANSIIERISNWCTRRMEEYEDKNISRISVDYIFKTVCSTIIRSSKFADKIENPKLRTGLKLDTFYIILLTTIILMYILIFIVMYIVATIIAIYLVFKLLQFGFRVLDRYQKGLPLLFPDKEHEYYTQKTSFLDSITGRDRKTIYDSEGKKVGDISTSFTDEMLGIDRKTIKDAEGKKVGDISTSFTDEVTGTDRKTIKDAEGKKVGDISTSFTDQVTGTDRKTIRIKKKEE